MTVYRDVKKLTNDYVNHGGKRNRRKQAKRMLALAAFSETLGCPSIDELGKRHIIQFYKANRHLSDVVLYHYFLAFRKLYELAGKPKPPPTPFLNTERSDRGEAPKL